MKKVSYFSTEENIKIENNIYERAAASKRPENQAPGFSHTLVQEYLDRSTLTEGQKEAMLFITGSKHRLRAIQASPGTGVPFLLNFARDFYEREGNYKVVALAPSNQAARNLKEKAGFDNASTLHAHFIQLQKEAGAWEAEVARIKASNAYAAYERELAAAEAEQKHQEKISRESGEAAKVIATRVLVGVT